MLFPMMLSYLAILNGLKADVNEDITQNVYAGYRNGALAAFGDFNSDQLTDAFIISNYSNFLIYLAYDKEPLLRPSLLACNFTKFAITSIVPGDYDGDAYMDILITTTPFHNLYSKHQDIRIIWGGKNTLNCSDADTVIIQTVGQPTALDYNQDMIVDLFGTNNKNERVFWRFHNSRTSPSEIPMHYKNYSKPIKFPHSNAFIDINNDNFADLLLTTDLNIEIWLGGNQPGFVFNNSIELLLGKATYFGQTLYLDVALNGQFFILLPVCYDVLCKNSAIVIYDNNNWLPILINFNDPSGKKWQFIPTRNEFYFESITMKHGDYDLDGYPDLLVTLQPEDSNASSIFLMLNKPCILPECEFKRTFEIQWNKFAPLKDTVSAAFYDFNMDGVLDIIYIKRNGTQHSMGAIKNELEYDTNFINVVVLTGLTNNAQLTNFTGIRKKKGVFGTNLPGPKISYHMISGEGLPRTGVCAQLPQSAYFSLQLPYSVFGLQRTPNFVDTLTVALSGYSHTWTQIIPNSQLIVIPYPPSDPSSWKMQLFVTPSKFIINSIYFMLIPFFCTLCCIAILHWREKREVDEDFIEINNEHYVRL